MSHVKKRFDRLARAMASELLDAERRVSEVRRIIGRYL